MKTYSHLYEELLSDDTIKSTIVKAADGKNKNNARHRRLREIKKNRDQYVPIVRQWLIDYDPKNYYHKIKVINDGISAKKREIMIPTYQEEEILNAVAIVLRKVLTPSMYEHSYASIQGRGTHLATKRIAKWIKRDCVNTRYVLQLDIHHFFKSIDQNVLYRKLKNKIRDKQFLELNRKIIFASPQGLPLGFPTSQPYANFYLSDMDHYIKEQLHAKYYARFSDDMLIFARTKEELHFIQERLFDYLDRELHLDVKPNWQIYPVDKPTPSSNGRVIDFLGYKHHRNFTVMRKKILLRFDRKIRHVEMKGSTNIKDARQLITYAGYLKHAQCYTWFQRHVSGKINLRYLRSKVSKYSKNLAKRRSIQCGTYQNP